MNHIYKVVFNKATGTFTAVAEYAKGQGKQSNRNLSITHPSTQYTLASKAHPIGLFKSSIIALSIISGLGLSIQSYAASVIYGTGASANLFDNSVAVGNNANANGGPEQVAIGSNTTANGKQSVVIGNDVTANGDFSIVIGTQPATVRDGYSSDGKFSVAIGSGVSNTNTVADADGDYSVALGSSAKTESAANRSVALGVKARTTQANSVALGSDSVGNRAVATTSGYNASVLTSNDPNQASTSASTTWRANRAAVSIGNGTAITRQITSVAAGSEDTDAVNVAQLKAVDKDTFFHVNDGTNNGTGNATTNSGKLDEAAGATAASALTAGINAKATEKNATAVGRDALANGVSASAYGSQSEANADYSFAAGFHAKTTGENTNAIGVYTEAIGMNSTAIGTRSKTYGTSSVSIGNGSISGIEGDATVNNTIAIGTASLASGDKAVTIGHGSDANGKQSVAIGGYAQATAADTSAFGRNSIADIEGGVAIGSQSNTYVDKGVVGYDPSIGTTSTSSNTTWKANRAAVAVGNGTSVTRQITSVAAGSKDTDAVNVAQLKSIANTPMTFTGNVNSDTDAVGDYVAGDGTQRNLGQSIKISGGATQASSNSNVKTVVTDGEVDIQLLNAPIFTGVVKGNSFDASGQKITNVTAGVADTDAVNVSQLNATNTNVAKGFNITADNGTADNVKLGDTVTYTSSDDNIVTTVTDNQIDFTLNNTLTVGETNPITINGDEGTIGGLTNTTYNAGAPVAGQAATEDQLEQVATASQETVTSDDGSITVTETTDADTQASTFDVSVNTDDTTITKDTDGNIKANTSPLITNVNGSVDTPANVNALATAGDITNAINNSGFNVIAAGNETGATKTLVKPSDTVTYAAGDNLTVVQDGTTFTYATAKEVNFDNVTVGPVVINKDTGINAGDKQITNVTAGDISATSTDAINGSQLHTVTESVNQGFNITADVVSTTDNNPDNVKHGDTIKFASADNSITTTVTNNNIDFVVDKTKVDIAYSANNSTNQTVSLADGFDFTDGTNTTAEVGANGVVKYNVITGNITSTNGLASTTNITGIASTGDVVNAINSSGFTVKANGDMGEMINPGAEVEFIDGKNIEVTRDAGKFTVATKADVDFDNVTVGPVVINKDTGINAGNKKITNVAAGTADTDAVNVSQLNTAVAGSKESVESADGTIVVTATTDAKNGATTFDVSVNTDNDTLVVDANTGAISVNTGEIDSTAGVASTTNADTIATTGDVVNAINSSGFTVKANGDMGEMINPGAEVEFIDGKNIEITHDAGKFTVATKAGVDFDNVTVGPVVINKDTGINAGDKQITNVASGGDVDTNAANIGDVKASRTTVTSSDNSIRVEQTNNNKGNLAYDIKVNAQGIVEAAQLPVVYTKADGSKVYKYTDGKFYDAPNGSGNTVATADIIASMQNADGATTNPTKLANVADGTISATSHDAVNGSQLHATNQQVTSNTTNITNNSTAISKGLNVGDGTTANNYQLGDTVDITGDGNITTETTASGVKVGLAKDITVDSLTAGNTIVNNEGITITNHNAPNNPVSVSNKGLDNGGNTITNVAAGVNATDAVNVGQLHDQVNALGYTVAKHVDRVESDLSAGIASAAAIENAPYVAGKWTYAAGASHYNSESAIGISLRRTADNGRWSINGGVSTNTQNDPLFRIGISGVID